MGFLGEYWGQRVVQNDNAQVIKLSNAKHNLAILINHKFEDKFFTEEINNLCDYFRSAKSIQKFQDIVSSDAVSYKINNTENLKLSDLRTVYKSGLFDAKYKFDSNVLEGCISVLSLHLDGKDVNQINFFYPMTVSTATTIQKHQLEVKREVIKINCLDIYQKFSVNFDCSIKQIQNNEKSKVFDIDNEENNCYLPGTTFDIFSCIKCPTLSK